MPSADLPLGPGSAGDAVRDLQRRLARAGVDTAMSEDGSYGRRTEDAVRRFQEARGLRVDGACGDQTWSALVEASFTLGDRLLYQRVPMLRGDDVADLQQRLGALGFHAGRVDGIFGPDTAIALGEFQRNVGLPPDGICGRDTMAELLRLGPRRDQQVKAGVLEGEHLRRSPRELLGRHIVVGESGGISQLAGAVGRRLQRWGAVVLTSHHPDDVAQAAEANAFQADVYLGVVLAAEAVGTVAYYGSPGYTSTGGKRLAEIAAAHVGAVLPMEPRPMRLPILRETRMTAVVCELGPAATVVEQSAALAEALSQAIVAWVDAPIDAGT